MRLIRNLFTSSIGRKYLMAITGLLLIAFLCGHLVGNLQIFSPADKINGYAKFLHNMGPMLWVVRGGLLVLALIHVWAAVTLKLENRRARGPNAYAVNNVIAATLSSRTMIFTGLLVLAFFIFHLLQFTIGGISDTFKANLPQYVLTQPYELMGIAVVPAGTAVDNVYNMMVYGFMNPWISGFYIIAIALLSMHLLHGADSAFQTLGWRNHKWHKFLKGLVTIFVVCYFLLSAAIPVSVLTGCVKLHEDTPAAVTVVESNK